MNIFYEIYFIIFRITEVEDELRKTREELEKKKEEEVSRLEVTNPTACRSNIKIELMLL
jgi:hypothetical protein